MDVYLSVFCRFAFFCARNGQKNIKETNTSLIRPLLNLVYLASCAYFAFSLFRGQLPSVFKSLSFVYNFSLYALGNSTVVRIPSTRCVRSDFNPVTASPKVWNLIPAGARDSHPFWTFENFLSEEFSL